MYIFLGIAIGFWIFVKLLRWWVMRKLRRQASSMFEQFANAAGASNGRNSENRDKQPRKAGWERAEHTKKVSSDEGEYVAFDEVSVSIDKTVTDNNTTTHTHIEVTEQRIEDAEWEDIK